MVTRTTWLEQDLNPQPSGYAPQVLHIYLVYTLYVYVYVRVYTCIQYITNKPILVTNRIRTIYYF